MKRIAVILSILAIVCLVATSSIPAERSPQWPSVRAEHLRVHPTCEACGTIEQLHVHHVTPVHVDPARELDLENLITLCRQCHFVIGHHRNWRGYNPNVREDAARQLESGQRVEPRKRLKWRLPVERMTQGA
jgi:phage terminase large subunit GpA-like protein